VGWSVPELASGAPSMQIELLPGVQKKPFTFHRMPVRCFATYRSGTVEKLLGTETAHGKLVQVFKGGDDAGTPFVGVIETRWFIMKDPIHWKYLSKIVLTGRGTFFVGVLRNYEAGIRKSLAITLEGSEAIWDEPGDVWDDEQWGPSLVLQTSRLRPDMYGTAFKFRFTDASTEEGTQQIDIGDVDYAIVKGNWALYGAVLEGVTMGTDL
jgi:hypothetical protein